MPSTVCVRGDAGADCEVVPPAAEEPGRLPVAPAGAPTTAPMAAAAAAMEALPLAPALPPRGDEGGVGRCMLRGVLGGVGALPDETAKTALWSAAMRMRRGERPPAVTIVSPDGDECGRGLSWCGVVGAVGAQTPQPPPAPPPTTTTPAPLLPPPYAEVAPR
jgi:hypothetical protein